VFIVNVVCERIGIFRVKLGLANPEEYSFKRNDDVVVDPKKKKKMVTDAGIMLYIKYRWLAEPRQYIPRAGSD
jgi:hypothetical protein